MAKQATETLPISTRINTLVLDTTVNKIPLSELSKASGFPTTTLHRMLKLPTRTEMDILERCTREIKEERKQKTA